MGVDGGNDKDWEANACKIQLIKQKGKVKALDEEVHSMYCPSVLGLLSFLEMSSPLICVLNITCFARKHSVSNNLCMKSQRCEQSCVCCEEPGDPVDVVMKLQRSPDFSRQMNHILLK